MAGMQDGGEVPAIKAAISTADLRAKTEAVCSEPLLHHGRLSLTARHEEPSARSV